MKKCTHCIEGKILPILSVGTIDMNKFPDCDYCNGTGEYEVNDKWFYEGKRLNDIRMAKQINLRKFCIDNNLDASKVSKMERGIIEASKEVVKIYESLLEYN